MKKNTYTESIVFRDMRQNDFKKSRHPIANMLSFAIVLTGINEEEYIHRKHSIQGYETK